jgi:hypothetical protein
MSKKPANETVDRFINAALAFGTSIPSSVNAELVDNGFDPIPDTIILQRVAELLAADCFFGE